MRFRYSSSRVRGSRRSATGSPTPALCSVFIFNRRDQLMTTRRENACSGMRWGRSSSPQIRQTFVRDVKSICFNIII